MEVIWSYSYICFSVLSYRHYILQLPSSKHFHIFKMKATLILVVAACAMAVVYGDLVCGKNYCKNNPCNAPIAKTSCRNPSVYRDLHAGKCACCPACVTFLNERAACKTYSKELGETPSAICREPLRCLSGVCTKVTPRR